MLRRDPVIVLSRWPPVHFNVNFRRQLSARDGLRRAGRIWGGALRHNSFFSRCLRAPDHSLQHLAQAGNSPCLSWLRNVR